jgi:CheY-like chemotaxis protein
MSGIGSKLRVLLVEDHADTAAVLARLLDRSGYIVRTAGTVADALQAAGQEPFDIIVSDIGLPDGDGYELMSQVRDRHQIKGIALSGHGTDDDLHRSRAAGFIAHVTKPVDFKHLTTLINQCVPRVATCDPVLLTPQPVAIQSPPQSRGDGLTG